MKTQPINFKGIFHTQVNVKNSRDLQGLMLAKQLEDEANVKIVIQHQYIGIVFEALAAYEKSPDYPYSTSWLFSHAKIKGYKLPKYLTDKVYDVYILTDKDRKDYERKLDKREIYNNALFIALKVANRVNKKMRNETEEDKIIQKIIETDREEQNLFDKFLKGRKIEPMIANVKNDGSFSAKID